MQRPSIWLMLVILLAGVLLVREPRLQKYDEVFLRWLLKNSQPSGPEIPLTVVDIGHDPASAKETKSDAQFLRGERDMTSPLEFALFLQAALEFKPIVVAFEPVLQWRERYKDQVQIFLDQAMHVPKLLVAAELTASPDLDAPPPEITAFTQVNGPRGGLVAFSGIGRQPDEDLRLISTLGFSNLPPEIADEIHVPLLFQYRGEVVPSFALQAAMLWFRISPSEVKIDIGSHILFPDGRKIPIGADGAAVINPNSAKAARHLALNELLLAAQQHESKSGGTNLEDLRDQIVLARAPTDPSASPDVFAAAIATIQGNSFVRRVGWIFDCVFILVLAGISGIVRRFSRIDLVLAAFAFSAAYCLIALALLSSRLIWLPGVLPLGAIWVLALACLFAPRRKGDPHLPAIAPSPPSP